MISNESVQRLIACDRETLVALMSVAHAAGRYGGGVWNIYLDPDIKALLDAAKAENARPVAMTKPEGWMTQADAVNRITALVEGDSAAPRPNRKSKNRKS